MVAYGIYKIIHIFGILTLFSIIGGLGLAALLGGIKEPKIKKALMITHGVATFLVLLGGFGLLARINAHGLPGWVIAKLGIWIVISAAPALLIRKPQIANKVWATMLLLGAFSTYLANYKPF